MSTLAPELVHETCAIEPMPSRAKTSLADTAAVATMASYLMFNKILEASAHPVETAKNLSSRKNDAGPLVVIFVIAIAVLLVLAAAISVAVVILCAQKGMNLEWYVKTSWFEVKVACRR